MKRFTDAGRQAVADNNLYAALSLALTMPDICGSLEDPGPGKTQKRYIRWCEKWFEPKFSGRVLISAENCFQLRCSLIHSGSAEIEPEKRKDVDRFEFFDHTAGAHLNRFAGNSVNGVSSGSFIQLKADRFSLTMYDAADEWDAALGKDAAVQKEKAKLLVIRAKGYVIDGISIG